jgi:DNA polymerase-3 subunit delta
MARLAAPEANYLVSRVGDDPELLEREIEKLATYAAGAPITHETIDAICSPTIEARVYELTDAVGRHDRHGSFEVLESMYATGDRASAEVARSVLFSLAKYVRQLLDALDLPAQMPANEVAGTLGVHPFTARKLVEQRERFDRRTLERALAALAEAQAGMVGKSGLEPAFTLEIALGRLLAGAV